MRNYKAENEQRKKSSFSIKIALSNDLKDKVTLIKKEKGLLTKIVKQAIKNYKMEEN